jgi:hypothetical protein
MSGTRTLTVIDVEDWSLLFDDQRLIDQGHSTPLNQLAHIASGTPVILHYVSACDTILDKMISTAGDASMKMTLAEALALCVKVKR